MNETSQRERKSQVLLRIILAVCTIVGALYLYVGFDSHALYLDANETHSTQLLLVKRTWWGLKKEEFAVTNEETPTGRRWMYYKPQPLSAAFDANQPKPARRPLPHRVTTEWLHEDRSLEVP